jgi:hypothetical protein
MRPPVIGKRRSVRTKDVALFALLVVSIGFLGFAFFHSGGTSETTVGTESTWMQPAGPAKYGESSMLENEDFFPEKNFHDTREIKKATASFPRIFCMVPSQPHARHKFRTILDTWGPWCDGIRFMIDPPEYSEPGKEHLQPEEDTEEITSTDGKVSAKIVLMNKLVRKKGNSCFTGGSEWNPKTQRHEPVFTTCRHIWEKVWRSWVYVSDHLAEKYDFFFKVDDDTYFFVPNMREVILEKGFKAEDMHYFGQRVFPIGPDRPIIAGALVGFSRATLKRLAQEYKQMPHEYGDRRNFKHGRCVDRDGATEEVTTSICVKQIGGAPEALYDESISPRRPHMLLWLPRDMLTFSRRDNSSSWFYKHAPRDVGTLENCCSYRPVGFHFMRSDDDLRRVHDLIIDPLDKREIESVVEKKVPEWKLLGEKKVPSCFDMSYYSAKGAALEAEYFLKVKRKWHERDPRHYEQKLAD